MFQIDEFFQNDKIKSDGFESVGLSFGKTGVPVFFCATKQKIERGPFELKNESELTEILGSDIINGALLDRMTHTAVRAFFESGGERLILVLLSLEGKAPIETEYFDGLICQQQDFVNRGGLHLVKDYDALGDVMLFPQAALILKPDALKDFYFKVQATLEQMAPYFLVVDPPYLKSMDALAQWLKGFDSRWSAVYFPWVSMEAVGFLPPSSIVASQWQLWDGSYGCAEAPSNRPLLKKLTPLVEIGSAELAAVKVDRRFNVIRYLPSGDQAFWGCSTLSHSTDAYRFIHIARTVRSLEDAILRLCEPYVFEPRTEAVAEKLQGQIESFLSGLEEKGILVAQVSDHRAFEVKAEIPKEQNPHDNEILLNLWVSFERYQDRLGLHYTV